METNNEPLELLVNELRQSNVRQYTCINDSGYSQLERNIVTILTTWQKEQDKVIIDKLVGALEKAEIVLNIEGWTKKAYNIRELLQSLK